MSVKELKFDGDGPFDTDCEFSIEDGKVKIELSNTEAYCHYTLDRNQADLLRLYLTEHLSK